MAYNWHDLTFRQCYRCGYESDDLDEFCKEARCKHGRANLCKWCSNHNYYHTVTVRKIRADKQDRIVAYKNQPCADCGKSYPPRVMDLHHIDPTKKEFDLSQSRGYGKSLKAVEEELVKCVVLCANCHRLRH
jgi:hypothetical protein